jgi:RNA polymerase sigma-70 factor (subfamily 1)
LAHYLVAETNQFAVRIPPIGIDSKKLKTGHGKASFSSFLARREPPSAAMKKLQRKHLTRPCPSSHTPVLAFAEVWLCRSDIMNQPEVQPKPEPIDHAQAKDFQQLLKGMRAGRREAVDEFWKMVSGYLTWYASTVVKPQTNGKFGISDVVQDTLAKAFTKLAQFQGKTAEQLLAWLRRILGNTALSLCRRFELTAKRKEGREISLDDAHTNPQVKDEVVASTPPAESQAMNNEDQDCIGRALATLSARERQAIELRFQGKLPFAAIARQLRCSEDAARKTVDRALKRVTSIVMTQRAG